MSLNLHSSVQRKHLQTLLCKDVYIQEICRNLTVSSSATPLADLKINLKFEQLSWGTEKANTTQTQQATGMLLGFIHMSSLSGRRGHSALDDTNMLPSKCSSCFWHLSDKSPSCSAPCGKILCCTSIKDAKQWKPRTRQDMTWKVMGGFPKSSERNWSVLIQASTQQKQTQARAVSLSQASSHLISD